MRRPFDPWRLVPLLPVGAILLLAGAAALEGWARSGVATPAACAAPVVVATIAWYLRGRGARP